MPASRGAALTVPAGGARASHLGKPAQGRRLAGYRVHRRFYEIGTPDALAETDAVSRRARVKGNDATT